MNLEEGALRPMVAPSGLGSGSGPVVPPGTIVTATAGHPVSVGNRCLGVLEELVRSWMIVPEHVLERVPATRISSFEVVTAVRHSIGFGVETGDDDQSLAYLLGWLD